MFPVSEKQRIFYQVARLSSRRNAKTFPQSRILVSLKFSAAVAVSKGLIDTIAVFWRPKGKIEVISRRQDGKIVLLRLIKRRRESLGVKR